MKTTSCKDPESPQISPAYLRYTCAYYARPDMTLDEAQEAGVLGLDGWMSFDDQKMSLHEGSFATTLGFCTVNTCQDLQTVTKN